MGPKRTRQGKHLHLFLACLILTGASGCAGFQGVISTPDYWQADQQMAAGNYEAAIDRYREIGRLYPRAADEGLFKIGCIQAHPRNPKKDYGKALESFRQLVAEYPRSAYRAPTDAFIAILVDLAGREKDLANRDRGAPALKRQVDALERQLDALQKQIEQMKEIDRSREEKRREMPPRK